MPDSAPAPTPPAEPSRKGVLLVSMLTLSLIAVSGSCALGSGLALLFGDDTLPSGDPMHAIAVMRSGAQVASIEQAGMIHVDGQGVGLVIGETILDREAEVASIDSSGVVFVDAASRGLVSAEGSVTWEGQVRWQMAPDGTITRAGGSEPWGKAVGYEGTRGDRRALAAYLLFFAER